MTKIELIERLGRVKSALTTVPFVSLIAADVDSLLEDINLDGVLDVQQPPPLAGHDIVRGGAPRVPWLRGPAAIAQWVEEWKK